MSDSGYIRDLDFYGRDWRPIARDRDECVLHSDAQDSVLRRPILRGQDVQIREGRHPNTRSARSFDNSGRWRLLFFRKTVTQGRILQRGSGSGWQLQ